jgi:hypothetical protein
MKENYMKNIKNKKAIDIEDDLLPEYNFDFSKSKPNRFAPILKKQTNFIQLEPDIQKVFKSSEEVNSALRAFIQAIPNRNKKAFQKE